MRLFQKRQLPMTLVLLLVMSAITFGAVGPGLRQIWRAKVIGAAAGATGSVLAATTDTGASQTFTTGILALPRLSRISASVSGDQADVRAESVVVTGQDENGTTISETLTAFTVNVAGTITGEKVFKKVTSILLPAMDGTGVAISLATGGSPRAADTNAIAAARTDTGASATVTTGTSINSLSEPRNITVTSGGTAGDIRAESVVITGTNEQDASITESFLLTVNSATTVTGTNIFKSVTSILYPAMDGTAATIAVGHGDLLGIGKRLKRNTIRNGYLNNVLEGTTPTVLFDADDLESNTVDLDSALDSTPVIFEYMETPE